VYKRQTEVRVRLPDDDRPLREDRCHDLVELLQGDLLRGLHGFLEAELRDSAAGPAPP